MPTYREYNARLASMRGMRRVTSTMKMVAASHLHRAQTGLRQAAPYGRALADLLPPLPDPGAPRHRLLAAPAEPRNALLLVVASNRGLCGGFNANIQRAARQWLAAARPRYHILRAAFVGRRGHALLHRDIEARDEPLAIGAHPTPAEALRLSRPVGQAFLDGHYDEVHLVGNRFVSSLVSRAGVERLLPIALPAPAGGRAAPPGIREPTDERLLVQVLRQWFDFQVFEALLHSVAAEHAARVIAMDSATSNLQRLESELTLLRNRARQASITKELAEIVGGAEALA
jgi:F-type H+-transporting ATPase subunit gamma